MAREAGLFSIREEEEEEEEVLALAAILDVRADCLVKRIGSKAHKDRKQPQLPKDRHQKTNTRTRADPGNRSAGLLPNGLSTPRAGGDLGGPGGRLGSGSRREGLHGTPPTVRRGGPSGRTRVDRGGGADRGVGACSAR